MAKILIVIDDDPIYQIIIKRTVLKVKPEIEIHGLLNGLLALEFMKQNYSPDQQYVLLLDVNMPVMNGWQFLDAFKKEEQFKNENINIYIASSSTDFRDVAIAEEYTVVTDFLSKPLTTEVLLKILE